MNILHLIFSIEKGGAETYIYNLLDNAREDVNFVICNHEGACMKSLNKCSHVEIIEMRNVLISGRQKIAHYCKSNHIHIIQTHFEGKLYWGPIKAI